MNETVTVDEAILKGHQMVTYPSMAIMLGAIFLCAFLGIAQIVPGWTILICFLLGFVLSWLYWSIMITKWRLWAFENVRNVHELKKRAIRENLIWGGNSIFEKTEIRSTEEQEKWLALQKKFDQEDVFIDDPTVPKETSVFYSKGMNYFEMAIMLLVLAVGIYMLFVSKSYVLGTILTLTGAGFAYKEFMEATNTEPQIILNDKGIQTSQTPFCKWADIKNEEVVRRGSGKSVRHYLIYDHPNGTENLQIDDFETTEYALNKLLILYRGRSRQL